MSAAFFGGKKCYKKQDPQDNTSLSISLKLLAEREGFEPPVPCGTPVFKTGVIDHSTISPDGLAVAVKCGCKFSHKF